MTKIKLRVATAAILGAAISLLPAAVSLAGSAKTTVKQVQVRDDFYSPTKLTISAGQTVKWNWSKQNFDSHNVTLLKGPSGVSAKSFTSATGSFGIKFTRKFVKTGVYQFYCTVHPTMNLTVTVKH